MAHLRKSLILLLATAVSAPVQAVAQGAQQTPENAQRFLTISMPETYRLGTDSNEPRVVITRTGPVSSPDVCITTIPGRANVDGSEIQMTLWWDQVLQVIHTSGGSVVTLPTRVGIRYAFEFGSADLATRAAFAMEFLRQHCDPTADTGF